MHDRDMMTDIHTTTHDQDDRLERPLEGRVVAGVAQGLANRLGIATGWVRLGFVIASFFGGAGLLGYLAGWILMPDERDEESIAQRYLGTVGNWSSWVGIALIGTAVLVIIDQTNLISGQLLFAAVLIGLGVLLYTGQLDERRSAPESPGPEGSGPVGSGSPDTPTQPAPSRSDAGAATDAEVEAPEFDNPDFDEDDAAGREDRGPDDDGGGQGPPPPEPAAPSAPRPRRQRRERSHLGSLTVALALIVMGAISVYDTATNVDVAWGVYLASFMIVIGTGLLVGAWVGRARWLIIPGFILLPLFLAVSVLPGQLRGEIGELNLTGVQILDAGGVEEMAIGDLSVDLRDIPQGSGYELSVSLGIGGFDVIVPNDRTVRVEAEVGIGQLVMSGDQTDRFTRREGGLGVDAVRTFGTGEADIVIRADLGIGQLRVFREPTLGILDRPALSCEPSSPNWPFAGELVCERRR